MSSLSGVNGGTRYPYPAALDKPPTTEEFEDKDIPEDDYEDETPEFDPKEKYTSLELEEFADQLLRADSNRELCRRCKEDDPDSLPYGEETGEVESVAQFDVDDNPLLDDEGNQLYLDFPELVCDKGHRWYKGEGPRRDIKGVNPILFQSHLYNRQRREIYVESGVPDPAFTMDRFGRPINGMYNRTHPDGRKVNTKGQRVKNGASFYRAFLPLPLFVSDHRLIILSILSVGMGLCLELLNKRINMQLICANIMKFQRIGKRREIEIALTPPNIG